MYIYTVCIYIVCIYIPYRKYITAKIMILKGAADRD